MWNILLKPKIIYIAIGIVLVAIIFTSVLLYLSYNRQSQTAVNSDFIENELVVSFSEPQTRDSIQAKLKQFKVVSIEELVKDADQEGGYEYKIIFGKNTDIKNAQEELNKLQEVKYADPNLIFKTLNDEQR